MLHPPPRRALALTEDGLVEEHEGVDGAAEEQHAAEEDLAGHHAAALRQLRGHADGHAVQQLVVRRRLKGLEPRHVLDHVLEAVRAKRAKAHRQRRAK